MRDEVNEMDRDAKLTAFALGELDDTEAAAMAAELEHDEHARRDVEMIRQTVEQLQQELQAEPGPELTDAQREAVLRGPLPDARSEQDRGPLGGAWIFTSRRVWAGVGLAAAACLVIAVMSPRLVPQPDSSGGFALDLGVPSAEASRELAAGEVAEQLGRRGRGDLAGALKSATPVPSTAAPRAGAELQLESTPDTTTMFFSQGDVQPQLREGEVSDLSIAAGLPAMPAAPTGPAGGEANLAYVLERTADPRIDAFTAVPVDEAGRDRRLGEMLERRAAGQDAPARVLDEALQQPIVDFAEASDDAAVQDREAYARIVERSFTRADGPGPALSTFSIDVDTASYANVRRMINGGSLPPRDAVRIEEMLNYFRYAYPPAVGDQPFSLSVEIASAPWQPEHRLARIGLRAQAADLDMRPPTSLVFLIDVSGSMKDQDKLPLLKTSLKRLVNRLTPDDKVGLVTYANDAQLVLPPTYCYQEQLIVDAIDGLQPGGSTNGGAGIELAYELASEHFIEGGINRVLLATDGDLNVGVTDESRLVQLIEEKRRTGVQLSVLGFGTGNFQDAKLEQLTNAGDGNFSYIDDIAEAGKVLVEEMGATLMTVARDVKVQVEFNPRLVGAYRLIGYENRALANQDFLDATKDAGEIGAGHTVTAFYELIPPEAQADLPRVQESRYRKEGAVVESDELMYVRVTYKQPDQEELSMLGVPVVNTDASWEQASSDFRFAAAVAAFGLVLRDSPHRSDADLDMVLQLAQATPLPTGGGGFGGGGGAVRGAGATAGGGRGGGGTVAGRRARAAAGERAPAEPAGPGFRAGLGGKPPAAARPGSYRADFIELVERTRALLGRKDDLAGQRAETVFLALTAEQVAAMSKQEALSKLAEVSQARRYANAAGETELAERLKAIFDLLMERTKQP
jgi:Ca-activated chloride channel family protein